MSNKDSTLITLGVLIMLSIVVYFASNSQKSKLAIASYNYSILKKEAIELDNLKKKYTTSSRNLDELRRFKGFAKESKNANIVKFEYITLSPSDLDNLSNKLLNSNLNIKSLNINRDDDFNASLEFEVAI
jgi:uncharacterized protein (UPF0333 family)